MSRTALRFVAMFGLLALFVLGLGQQTPPKGSAQPPPTPGATALDKATKDEILASLQDVVLKKAFVPGIDFTKWPTFLESHHEDLDKAGTDVDFARELTKILRQFGVSHIGLRTPRAATARTTGTTSGSGMLVRKTDAGLEVTTVFPAGPAGQAGIEVGDIIKEIDGKPADDPAAVRVEAGKTLVMKIVKKGGQTKDLTLEAKTFSSRRPETLTWIGEDAAVLRIWTFANGYDRKNVEELIRQANTKAKYLVIDLRSNGGGYVSNLNHLLSLLMPSDTAVGTFIGRSTADEYAKTHKTGLSDPVAIAAWNDKKFRTRPNKAVPPFTGKIAVLINRGSASASEICSAALKDCRDALLVGANSAGAVLASTYAKLPGGFEIQYPLQDYVTIKGERLEGHPREPDVAIVRKPDAPDDAAQQAIDLMKKKSSGHSNTGPPIGHELDRAA